MAQGVLIKMKQHVALVFVLVKGGMQLEALRGVVVDAPRVMARCNVIETQIAPALLKRFKLHKAVAIDAWIGCFSR